MNEMTRITETEISKVTRRPTHWHRGGLALIAVLAVAGTGLTLIQRVEVTAPAVPQPIVTVANPLVRDVVQWDEYIGRFAASKTVEVRPRVSGTITAIHFRDGQMVQEGQLLFTVDPRPYVAALDEARAAVATATSTLTLARSDYQRASRLRGDNAVSAGELDALRSRVQSAEAGLGAAEARASARALDVEFTDVRAPIAGRISDRRVDAGNLVAGGERSTATLLTTINTLNPIYFSFDASEALWLKAQRARSAGEPRVEVRLQDESGYRWRGTLDFTDNAIDPRSGTIRGRATIANPDLVLVPGLFGKMRMATGGSVSALLVPDMAVQTDQADKAVLVLNGQNEVVSKKVHLGPMVDGLRIVASGLLPTDRVIIGGGIAAAPGAKAQPTRGMIRPITTATSLPIGPIAAEATFASQ